MNPKGFFVTGGALQVNATCYVERRSDREVLEALRRGEFCYVLTSRQMGKSSLMVRTAAILRETGCAVVILDLTAIGQNLDAEQWYFSMLCHVGEKLNLEAELEAFWDANERRAPMHRFFAAIRDVCLERIDHHLVIFVDEIDAVRSLHSFSADEFFAGIRECYNRRSEDARFERLTFCLLGVATPSDLICDPCMTPFNIGTAIELGDFSEDDAKPLAEGLSSDRAVGTMLLGQVFQWTGGHPYLTQKLCLEVTKAGAVRKEDIDAVCARVFLSSEARERDDNLHFVRDRLLRGQHDRAAILDSYAKLCRGERVLDDRLDPLKNELRLSGIARVSDGQLKIRNRIYSKVFNLQWVRDNLPDAEIRRQRAAFYRGVRRVAGVSVIVLAIMGGLAAKARRSAEAERMASQRATEAATKARIATEREKAANRDALAQAAQTKRTLNRLVDTQTRVAGLLEALTPLVNEKSGKLILERAEGVVDAVAKEPGNDAGIAVAVAGLRQVCGQLYLRLGDEDKALEQALEARQLVEAAMKRGHGSPDAKKKLHGCMWLVGDALLGGYTDDTVRERALANYNRAIVAYGDAVVLAKSEVTARPGDVVWRGLYFSDLIGLGDTARRFNELKVKDAEKYYGDALNTMSEWRKRLPNAVDLRWIEATIHDRLGTLFLDVNQSSKARAHFDRSLAIRQSAPAGEIGDDPERQSGLATSYNKLGKLFNDQKQWKMALDYYERSLAIRRKLCEQSKDRRFQRDLGFSMYNVSRMQSELGAGKQALALSEERLKLAEALNAEDRTDPELIMDRGNALYAHADLLLNVSDTALRDWPLGLRLAEDAVEVTKRRDPRILVLLAQALRLAKRPAEALQVAEEANKLLPPEDKRNAQEKEAAKEIAYELQKGNGRRN